MAQIGYGYGSEWQLLRMLGHHREYFYKELRNQIGLSSDADIHWLDYGFDESNISGDKEYKQREFFETIPNIFTPPIIASFEKDSFGKILNQNWDGVFWVDNIVYLVEAKAHLREILSDCQAVSQNSISKIENDLKATKEYFNITSNNDWKKTYYQMANRVAFLKLLLSHGVESRLVNIYFVDGYEKKIKDTTNPNKLMITQSKNTSKEDWEKAIIEEENYLGISRLRNKLIFPVYVNCKSENRLSLQHINKKESISPRRMSGLLCY